jgi:hypothetical protein
MDSTRGDEMEAKKHPLQRELEDAGHEVRSYSGRGMYGKDCLGCDSMTLEEFVLFAFELGSHLNDDEEKEDERDLISRALARVKTDSMGMGIIIYFPGVEFYDNE